MSAQPTEDLTALLPLDVIAACASDDDLAGAGFGRADAVLIQYWPAEEWPASLRHRFVAVFLAPDPLDED